MNNDKITVFSDKQTVKNKENEFQETNRQDDGAVPVLIANFQKVGSKRNFHNNYSFDKIKDGANTDDQAHQNENEYDYVLNKISKI